MNLCLVCVVLYNTINIVHWRASMIKVIISCIILGTVAILNLVTGEQAGLIVVCICC
jgi:hypothetical protein